jgi:dihydrolipoamide dehydrogenase
LPVEDQEVSETLLRSFTKQGIRVLTSAKVEKGEVTSEGIKVTLAGSKPEVVQAEVALVAIGVSALLPAGLNFELERGFIKVNDSYQTSIKDVYGAGDVIGPPWLAHVAFYEASQAVEGMFTDHKPKRVTVFPGCTYCQPQVASIGMTEKAAKESGQKFKVGKFPFKASGKALAVGRRKDLLRSSSANPGDSRRSHHRLRGYRVDRGLGLAMTLGATFEEVTTIHAHPTLANRF